MKKSLLAMGVALLLAATAVGQTDEVLLHEAWEDATSGLPEGWTSQNYDGSANDASFSNLNNTWQKVSLDAAYTQRCIVSAAASNQQTNRWLVTPQIAIPDGNYELAFTLKDIAGAGYQHVQVMASTSGTQQSNFTQIADITAGSIAGVWTEFTVSLSQYSNQEVYLAFVNRGVVYGIALDDVEVHSVADYEISLRRLTAPSMLEMGTDGQLEITVRNGGVQPITSFTVSAEIDGTEDEHEVNGVNIASGQEYRFTYGTPIHVDRDADVEVHVTVSLPEEAGETYLANNEARTTVQVYDPSLIVSTKRTLVEHYTTARCSNCPRMDQQLAQVLPPLGDRVVVVEHHVGYYTDDLTIPASEDMLGYYNSNQAFAPALMIDRSFEIANMFTSSVGPVFSTSATSNSNLTAQLEAGIAKPSFVTVEITGMAYDAQTRELTFTAEGEFTRNIAFQNATLVVFLTEDSVVAPFQAGASGSYRHDDVIRAVLSESGSIAGDLDVILSSQQGDTYGKSFRYTLPTEFQADHCHVVAFVADVSNDATANLVHNAVRSDALMSSRDPYAGIGDVASQISVSTYPNPAHTMAYVSAATAISHVEMTNSLGQQVRSYANVASESLEINLEGLSSGLYYITVTTKQGRATERLSVVK